MKKIYVGFDLDETLIHSKDLGISNEPYLDCDFNIMEKNKYKYSVYIRPNSILLLNYSSSIDKTYLNTIYEGRKRFETKRLDKISKKMKINIDDVIFFDDIKNNNEIRPLKNVVKVPAYFGSDFDNALGKIYKLFKDSLSLNLNEYDFKNFILNIDENYLKDDYKIKEIKIIKNKIEP